MARPRTIMIDLDGTICTEERTFDRPLARLLDGALDALRRLKAEGHTLIIYTARGWAEYRVTKAWLDDNGVPYDGIHMGKPIADVWIDDRAIRFTNWTDVLAQLPR